MRGHDGKNDKSGLPHSERAGEAVLGSGERATLYRALRELSCSRCGGVIREGGLFTREEEPASGLPLIRCCHDCVPFMGGGRLLSALLDSESGGVGARAAADVKEEVDVDVKEKVLSRLGPALAARRRRRGAAE
jgi:hypothetical protein